MGYTIMDNRKGDSCRVDENGYVDFGNCDGQYDSEKAAITALENEGWHVVGWE